MRKIEFYKYQGTGNDFVMLDNSKGGFDQITSAEIQQLSNRRFGIGADGVILVMPHPELDFEMRYFNADGSRSFCGNGARCAVRFAEKLGLASKECEFLAIDGKHSAQIFPNEISLAMSPVKEVLKKGQDFVCNTGSPHYIQFTDSNLSDFDIRQLGKEIRYSDAYKEEGINVNLANEQSLEMLTYERGVEDETLSCGTGATAVALAYAEKFNLSGKVALNLKVKGGKLQVAFETTVNGFEQIRLIGPAMEVFKGVYEL